VAEADRSVKKSASGVLLVRAAVTAERDLLPYSTGNTRTFNQRGDACIRHGAGCRRDVAVGRT
jgi:hypothetical protein